MHQLVAHSGKEFRATDLNTKATILRSLIEEIELPIMAESFLFGPLRALAREARCCGRNPHSRHSLQPQKLRQVELTVCGEAVCTGRDY